MPAGNLTNDSALSWLLSPQAPGTEGSRAPGLGSSLLLLLAEAGGQCQCVTSDPNGHRLDRLSHMFLMLCKVSPML